ncbi:MAG: hypothetical protein RL095_939 [Verrucomicrobiota bacterium]|jgi:ABC-type Mn2+/Zn2+ transport system permease subunit
MHWLLDPWQEVFMRRAFMALLLIAPLCAILGCHVLLRRIGFIGDALAHASLPGVAAAALLGVNLQAGALIGTIGAALLIGAVARKGRIGEDGALMVVFTSMLALGYFLLSKSSSFKNLQHILFGSLLSVTPENLLMMGIATLICLAILFGLGKELALAAADPIYAQSIGINPDRLRLSLLMIFSLALVAGISAVGVMMVSALAIIPAATARLLCHRLNSMMAVAAALAMSSSILGLYCSYWSNSPAGATIILISSAQFFGIWAWQLIRNRHHA